MTSLTKIGVGDLAEISFLDHCEDPDSDTPMEFTVWGKVTVSTKDLFEITCWAYADGRRHADRNEKRFHILKAVVTKIRKLR